MSMFFCAECDELRDADDGCDEIKGQLVCVECAKLAEEIEEELHASARGVQPG